MTGLRRAWYNGGKEMVYIMKRWLCLLLVLFLLPAAAMADSPVDPVLVPIAPETLPQGQYCHLGGSLILVQTGGEDPLRIYDLDTGESIVVTPREEDLDLWVAPYVASWAAEGIILTDEEIEELTQSYGVGAFYNIFVFTYVARVISIGSEYAMLNEGLLLNRHTGVITFIPKGLPANRLTPWDTFLSTNEEQTACLQYDINGQLLNTASFEDSEYQLWDIQPLKNGAVAILGLTDKEEEMTHCQCFLLDKELNVQQVIDLGEHHNRWLGIEAAHLHEESGRLLLFTEGKAYNTRVKAKVDGKFRIREIPNGPYLNGLLLIDTETSEVHSLDEVFLLSITSFLASSDGSYVLLPDPDEERLLNLDMETGLITEQMSTSEDNDTFKPSLDAWNERTGQNIIGLICYLSWDGGDYAVTPWMIFRVVERSCNP